MFSYLMHMAKDDMKIFGFKTAWYNTRFMLAWDIASLLTRDLKQIKTGNGTGKSK